MIALLISLIVGVVVSVLCSAAGLKNGVIAYGVVAFIVAQIVTTLVTRRRFKAVNNEMQDVLMAGQKRIQHKVNQFQSKPGGNPRLIQQQLEKDQHALFESALEFTKRFEPYKKWNVFMSKQISTMRLQFLYQLKRFEEVDEIFAKGFFTGPVLSDPILVSMKMARQYTHKKIDGVEKTFKRYKRWFRDDRGALLYGVMSWVYVKDKRIEDARQLLGKAKEKMYNEVLTRNWEALSNNREKSFSNQGFGDPWYSLYLENPPAPKQQRMRNQKGHRPF